MFDPERCSFTNTFHFFPLNIPPLFWTKPFWVMNPNATENITNAQGLLRGMPFHHYCRTSFTLRGFLKWKWFWRGESADREWDRRDEVNPGQGCDWTVMIWSSCVRTSDASCQSFCSRKRMKVLISPQFLYTHVCDSSQSSGLLSLFLLVERRWLIYVRQNVSGWQDCAQLSIELIMSFKFQIEPDIMDWSYLKSFRF